MTNWLENCRPRAWGGGVRARALAFSSQGARGNGRAPGGQGSPRPFLDPPKTRSALGKGRVRLLQPSPLPSLVSSERLSVSTQPPPLPGTLEQVFSSKLSITLKGENVITLTFTSQLPDTRRITGGEGEKGGRPDKSKLGRF